MRKVFGVEDAPFPLSAHFHWRAPIFHRTEDLLGAFQVCASRWEDRYTTTTTTTQHNITQHNTPQR